MPTLAAALWLARDLLLALILLLCCAGPGQPLVGRLPGLDRFERRVLGAVAGMAVLSFGLGLLAIAGLFTPAAILAVLAIAQLGWRWRSSAPTGDPLDLKPRVMVVAAALPAALLLAAYPAAAFDDTLYHLPIACGLIENGGATFLPELRYPAFPFGQEVWMAAALALGGGDASVHFFAVGQLALLAAVVGLWSLRLAVRHSIESEAALGSDPFEPAGMLAPALLLGSPLLVWLGSTAYVDLAVALYGTAALFAFDQGRRLSLEGAAATPRLGWWVLAGTLAGAAAAVKYIGLFFVVALTVVAASLECGRRRVLCSGARRGSRWCRSWSRPRSSRCRGTRATSFSPAIPCRPS